MIDNLKKIYQTLRPYNKALTNYYWFQNQDDEIFGINQSELTEKDMHLLLMIFQAYHPELPSRNNIEELWYNRIFHKKQTTSEKAFRFIYFSFSQKQMQAHDFKEALATLFEKNLPILWESEHEGIMVEEVTNDEDLIAFEKIIDILMADLSVNIYFFINQLKTDKSQLLKDYEQTLELGRQIEKSTNEHIIHFSEAAPFIVLNDTSQSTRVHLSQMTLGRFYHDNEMLRTLEEYFTANLNISETAKKLYMHRNSIQYRIDKFTKETGINIQNFNEAMTVKLAILAKNMI